MPDERAAVVVPKKEEPSLHPVKPIVAVKDPMDPVVAVSLRGGEKKGTGQTNP